MIEPKKRAIQRVRLEPAQQLQLESLQRRNFLRGGLTVGAMAMLTGCNLQDGDQVDKVLWAMSRWNDRVQAWLFNGQRLAPTFTKAQMTRPFPFNAFYAEDDIPEVDLADWSLAVSGLVRDKADWTLEGLRKLPQRTDITRLICVEGWSAIGQWGGVPLRTFLEQIRWLQMRGSLLLQPGHAHRLAPPDAAGAGLRRGRVATGVWLSVACAGPDQAGVQEPQAHCRDFRQ
jgi:hypothetical protein